MTDYERIVIYIGFLLLESKLVALITLSFKSQPGCNGIELFTGLNSVNVSFKRLGAILARHCRDSEYVKYSLSSCVVGHVASRASVYALFAQCASVRSGHKSNREL